MRFRFLLVPFILGLLAAQRINLLGELFLGEVFFALYAIANFRYLRLSVPERGIVFFALVWAGVQLLSDLHNQTEVSDAIKGIFAPIVFAITFVGLISFCKGRFERFPSFALGATIGALIHLLIFPTEYFIFNAWKWGLGPALLGVFVIFFSFFLKRKSQVLLFVVLIFFLVVSLYFDARSLAVFPFLAAVAYKKFSGTKESWLITKIRGNLAGVKLVLVTLPVAFVMNAGASALFSSEDFLAHLSDTAAAKYKTQATGAFGMLLGGRSEILVSGQAFLDKPFLGHGSWAKDTEGYRDQYSILRYQLGYSLNQENGYEDLGDEALIPVHSYLMGAFVWAGIFGGLFWLIVLNKVTKIFVERAAVLPYYFYAGTIALVWDVFFSPFGAYSRWGTAIFLAALFSYESYRKSIGTKVI